MSQDNCATDPNQQLPQLPVPDLNDTLQKLLATIRVLVNDECFNESIEIIEEFQNGIGQKLQQLIMEKAQRTEYWLADWAMNYKYLSNRNSVVFVTSPGLKLPIRKFNSEADWLEYAAKIVYGSVLYQEKIANNELPPEKIGNILLDMNQYKNIFGTCRIPLPEMDQIVYNFTSKHIVVAYKNEFFKVPVYCPISMKPLSKENIFNQLSAIVAVGNSDKRPSIGILSTLPREEFFGAFYHLMQDRMNQSSVESIILSLFLLCLDDPITWCGSPNSSVICKQLLHGGGAMENSANRWFDKTVQFVINRNGINGITYEHTLIEGQAIVNYSDYLLKYYVNETNLSGNVNDADIPVEKLEFNISANSKKHIQLASDYMNQIVDDMDINVVHFKKFGKEFIKKHKLSPDSFIQIAFQLAYYKCHESIAAQYETVHLRKFLHGRTEGVRSTSKESIAFVHGMNDSNINVAEKVKLLRAAINIHKNTVEYSMNGKGIEKHLSGLKLIAKENDIPQPTIFENAGFIRANTFEIETSQVASANESFMFYGPLYKQNYAVCYNPRCNDIFVIISISKSCTNPLNVINFGKCVMEAFEDMYNLLEGI